MARHIIVQIGHEAPREPGHESETGAAGELERNRKIARRLAKLIQGDARFTVEVVPGRIPSHIRDNPNAGAAFISEHCDGSADRNVAFPSFGYPPHSVNAKLARLILRRFEEIPHPTADAARFNYTAAQSQYYAWNDIDIAGPEVLVENGFVSNFKERAWIDDNIGKLARAQYLALLDYFELPERGRVKRWGTKFAAWAGWKILSGKKETRPKGLPKPSKGWKARLERLKRKRGIA